MNEATDILAGAAGAPSKRSRGALISPWALAAGITGLLLGADLMVWFMANSRADEAIEAIVFEAEAFRESEALKTARPAGGKGRKKKAEPAAVTMPPPEEDLSVESLVAYNRALSGKLEAYAPSGVYIIIDTANNRLYMKKGSEILLETVCSTGSYSKLDAPDGRSWFFHTPRGSFKVKGKIQKPVWVKPDWAFVEENEPIPSARHPDRYEPYVMGDYALAFGNGYYIHGTLYRRLLGQSVTHGCVRLGDQELEQVFKTAPVGTPIFIY